MERFYGELASWWPLISPVEEYAEEATEAARLLGPARDVLELGSGGGHLAAHLKDRYALTLTDISGDMLAVSRALNPDCEHIQGDMRTLRLNRTFDAVLIHDAIAYMASEDDLRAALATAAAHLRPGGRLLVMPDEIAETFAPGADHGGSDGPDGRAARYLEWSWDPDPADTWTLNEYAFLLREPDGTVRAVHETHRTGLFARAAWLALLREAGFNASAVPERIAEDRTARELFVATACP
jgi:SAM-dependent methyltransferase